MSSAQKPHSLDSISPDPSLGQVLSEKPDVLLSARCKKLLRYVSALVFCVVLGQVSSDHHSSEDREKTSLKSIPLEPALTQPESSAPVEPHTFPQPVSEVLTSAAPETAPQSAPQYLALMRSSVESLQESPTKTALLELLRHAERQQDRMLRAEQSLAQCRIREMNDVHTQHGRLQLSWTSELRSARTAFDTALYRFLQALDPNRMQARFATFTIDPQWSTEKKLEFLRSRYMRETFQLAICQAMLQQGVECSQELAALIARRRDTRGRIDVLSIQYAMECHPDGALPAPVPESSSSSEESRPQNTENGPRWF